MPSSYLPYQECTVNRIVIDTNMNTDIASIEFVVSKCQKYLNQIRKYTMYSKL